MSQSSSKYQFSREQLFSLVWTRPMRILSKEFGLSDVGLAKICRKHNIPLPGRGHWAKKAAGKASPTPQLGPSKGTSEVLIDLTPATHSVDRGFDSDFAGMYEKVLGLSQIQVPASLENPHPLVLLTKKLLSSGKATSDRETDHQTQAPTSRSNLPLAIAVDKNHLPRALRLFDILIKNIELLGGRVENQLGTRWLSFGEQVTQVFLGGEAVVFLRIREIADYGNRTNMGTSKTALKNPNRLVIEGYFHGYLIDFARDTNRTVEFKINRALLTLIEYANKARAWRKNQANAEVQKKREAEERASQAAEQKKIDQLLRYVQDWQLSCQVRGFLQAVRKQYQNSGVTIEDTSDLGRWLTWADRQADKLDPLAKTEPTPSERE